MPSHPYRLLNVFADSTFNGNPLCVFEDGTGLSDETMLNLARQFNLSETVFLFPVTATAADADAALRIFTPTGELPFAGHPCLGSAQVVRQRLGRDALTLRTAAGAVPLTFSPSKNRWTLTAPRAADEATMRPCDADPLALCRLLGLDRADLASNALWCDTGSEQLLLPLSSPEAVRRARPDDAHAGAWPANGRGRKNVFLFAIVKNADGGTAVHARYFFKSQSGIGEDPGTGSACINLGAWHYMQIMPISWQAEVTQGVEMGRPCRILLDVSAQGGIRIGGSVIELGGGTIHL